MTTKALNLVDYLMGLAKVNAATVRDCKDCQILMWLDDIPHDRVHCYSRARGADENFSDDIWLEIRKLHEPALPTVPKACMPWVDEASLRRLDDLPTIQSALRLENTSTDPETGESIISYEVRELADHPAVREAWDGYLSTQWMPWSDAYRHYQQVQKIYAALFGIYQEQQRLGEQYELVLGLGLLTWRQPGGLDIHRHLVVAKASLEFESALGRFVVRAAPDGDQAEVEFDMLEPTSYPTNSDSLLAEGRKLRDNLWDRGIGDAVLAAIANSLDAHGRGRYEPDAMSPSESRPADVPLVEFAPALILRKRSLKGLLTILSTMRSQLESGVAVPAQFSDLCEIPGGDRSCVESGAHGAAPPDEVFFPLPANEQQYQIIYKLNAETGVLVQGPPGTGKSLTISNMICHLLATGQRVLVTAKAPRALEVLHDKIPGDVAPLCISMLGSGTDERESLERSVNGILSKVNSQDDLRATRRAAELERRLRENRAAKAQEESALIALRERETFEHVVAGGAYKGTAASIAAKVRESAKDYAWFTDQVGEADTPPLSPAELEELAELCERFDGSAEAELAKAFPNPEQDIPTGDQLRDAWHQLETLRTTIASGAGPLASPDGQALVRAKQECVAELCEALERLGAEIESVRRRPMPWVAGAIQDVLQDLDTPLKELHRLTAERLDSIRRLAEKAQAYSVDIPAEANRKRLGSDAKALRAHLAAGGSLKQFMFFEHPAVKKHGATLRHVLVDGQECMEIEPLQKLIDYLTVEQVLAEAWSLWAGKTVGSPAAHFLMQLAQLDEQQEALGSVLGLYALRADVLAATAKVPGLAMPAFSDRSALSGLAQTCRCVLALAESKRVDEILRAEDGRLAAAAARLNAHPLCAELLAAFRAHDYERYCQAAESLRLLSGKFAKLRTKHDYLCRLSVKAPVFAATLSANAEPGRSASRPRELPRAWAWRQAAVWLEKFESQDGDSRERNVKRLEDDILRDLEELAALKSWGHCFSRMTREHQQHLETWQQAMRRLGKGTGKHAHKHRLDAQRHLNACKGAVPAWIMPLHRVYETVEASPGAFDVIIVDEASQCGFEALPLLYLAKKIIVVGDEKQISPEAVGTDRTHVQALMRAHLRDFVHSDSFDIENSLFAHGRIRFGNRITLREHFRCAPEIIRFSNELCYTSDPLIPLKQCPPDRLEPLQAVHVPSGYREGSGSNVVNRPEAEALVAKIVECCADERYAGMSMGVITLQGDAQAGIIEGLLLKALGAEEMQERRLLCGNPYSFQGDERDVIFLSMVAARGERIGALTMEKDMRRFNVAASRAREQMWLFHSVTLNDLSEHCFRKRLLNHFLGTLVRTVAGVDFDTLQRAAFAADRWREKAPAPFDSWFEVDVALAIAARGYQVVPQFEFAGKRIDLVVQGDRAQLAVECDGDYWHGRDAYEADMARQRMLERCRWVFFRVRESCYRSAPERALEPLWAQLAARGIFPPLSPSGMAAESASGPVPDVHFDEDLDEAYDVDAEEEVEAAEDEVGREGDGALPSCPHNIQEALTLKPAALAEIIVATMKAQPNHSCIRRNLVTIILRKCGVRTRSGPREQFRKKVDAQVAVMLRSGKLIAYKSKNERLKLGWNA